MSAFVGSKAPRHLTFCHAPGKDGCSVDYKISTCVLNVSENSVGAPPEGQARQLSRLGQPNFRKTLA